MKRYSMIFLLCLGSVLSAPVSALASLDQFVGDSAIYSATTEYLRPNVLFVVDNSAGMEQSGSREVYDPVQTYPGSYVNNKVYERKTATGGVINYVQYIDDVTTDVTCSDAQTALQTTGYFAGPLKKNDGSCTASQSGNFFLGNLLNYINTPTGAWQAETVYAVGDLIRRVESGTHYIYECTVGGTSGSTEPTWPTTSGATVTDNEVTWQVANPAWTADTAYEVGDLIRKAIDGTDYIFECSVAGTSGSTEPTWPTSPGSSVTDGGVTWALPGDIIDMVKDTLAQVVQGARPSVNFGLMVFGDNNAGGKVLRPIQKIALTDPDDPGTVPVDDGPTNYSALQTAIAGITLLGSNNQPVNELFHDVSYYFTGHNDSSNKIASDNVSYPYPVGYTCQKNFIIVLTTGATDTNNPKTRAIGDLDGDGNQGFVDDLTKYLYETDLDISTDYTERIQTHIIQLLTPEVMRLKRATDASHGRGDYFHVNNSNELTEALLNAMANIVNESDTSFVAPVVPTSPENRTYSGERVYLGFFKPISQRPWHGNLKKYGIDDQNRIVDKNGVEATLADGSFNASAVSFWSTTTDAGIVEEGGAGEILLLRNPSTRLIYTNTGTSTDLTDSSNLFNSTNVSAGDLGVAGDAARDSLIDFIYGYDAYDDDGDGTYGDQINGEKLDWILGDILHSKPQIINYNHYAFTTANENNCSVNKTMIYVGTNDGMLHAFRDCDGGEAWAFIPDNVVPNLKELGERPTQHTYFVDSSPVSYIFDKDNDGNIGPSEAADGDSDNGSDDKVIILFGLRRGGDAYYALDVSNPASPSLQWHIHSGTSGFERLGETWSEPQLGKMKIGTAQKVVAFFGGGYDTYEDSRFGNRWMFPLAYDVPEQGSGSVGSLSTYNPSDIPTGTTRTTGRAVYALEVADVTSGVPVVPSSPTLVKAFHPLYHAALKYDYAFASDIAVLDTDFNGLIDRLYVGNTGGQIWRFDVGNTDKTTWTQKPIFWDYSGAKFFYRPSVTFEHGYTFLFFGTGDREHPLNTGTVNRFYAFKDRNYADMKWYTDSNFKDVTLNELQIDTTSAETIDDILNGNDGLNNATNLGWYIRLNRRPGEKVLASPLAFNKVAYFTTYTPNSSLSVDPCEPGNLGVSRLYAVDYKTGEAVLNFANADTPDTNNDLEDTDNNRRALSKDGKVLRRDDREITLGVGIPSGLVVLMPPSGDAKLLIGCGGGLCSEDPVTGGTIVPIYWLSW
ncbi:pilus assembly protein [Desulfuromonas sp. TF]|uniref:pilus assembly protein n=1 Tax=Desulfuromonas sp. TF TaxID=1232410 RepID=UPI0004078C53|nr:PilC/PilY family type IV pilus protein [Desulfuromonas sp. TF]